MNDLPQLHALAEQAGILSEYLNYNATRTIVTRETTKRALLRAMNLDFDPKNAPQVRATARDFSAFPPCFDHRTKTNKPKLLGLWVNLYSLRSRGNWGVGDLGDLMELIAFFANQGLDFIGLNPLHALRNRGNDISPYRPVSRLFRNEIYLQVEAVPEFTDCEIARRMVESPDFQARKMRAQSADWVDYDAVFDLKRGVLRALFLDFENRHARGETERGRAYRRYIAEQGEALTDFATFVALDEFHRVREPAVRNWREWPPASRDPKSAEVERFRRENRHEVEFHQWVQFELDRQLGAAAGLARAKGMAIGLYQDLAVGTSPDGCDPWAYPGLFAHGASVGAPPDDLGPTGQDWALPPIIPHRLIESDFRYWRDLLRAAFAHAGALRIDHAMGLQRLFWIPEGMDGTSGAYVRYPAEELFGLLAEESRRREAAVIGEDLGTVPAGFGELMERWNVLSTRVMHFERDHDGEYRSPSQYAERACAVASTHDMVPLAGFASGRDLILRRQAGAIESDEALHEALARRRGDHEALLRALGREGLWNESDTGDAARLCAAVHGYLARTASRMVGFSLDDLAGETEPVNLPGVGPERYRSWSRRMSRSVEEVMG